MRRDLRFVLLLACFFLSGFAGLLYETAWTRQFAFVFGTSELAVVTVLAAYFGGLTVGATLAARLGVRVRRPVLVYALIELGIAAAALSVPAAIHAATRLHVLLFGGHVALPAAGGLTTALFYLICSFAILLVPTALMGATLPLLAGYCVHSDEQVGRRVGWLYAINTLGAVAGTLCTAFLLLPAMGLSGTVWVGVLVNALVFVGAVLLSRALTASRLYAPVAVSEDATIRPDGRLILPLILISGAVSFTYEVLWTRLLGHILGGSVYAFATMLASFLLGIALGSAIAARKTRSPPQAACAFGWVQIGTASLTLIAFMAVNRLPALAGWLGAGATSGLAANVVIAALVLLPGAIFIGATFPLAVRVLARGGADAGPASGRVYAWNTVGAIIGAIGTGFVVLPALEYGGTLTAAAAVNLALAAVVGFAASLRAGEAPAASRRVGLTAVCGFVVLALVRPGEPWSVLRSSALTSSGQNASGKIVYYGVGRSATVLLTDDGILWSLRTNGLQEAKVLRPDTVSYSQNWRWLTGLPVIARPDARKMLVIGLGGGNSLEAVPDSVTSIDVIEIEPDVLAANRCIADLRADDPLSDPRVRVCLNDARAALQLTSARYDIIVSQPSHPWTAGASHLYTREFFALLRDHLTPEGAFVQWMGLGFVNESLLKSLIATLGDVFAHVRVYRPVGKMVLFLASATPLPVEQTAARLLTQSSNPFKLFGILAPEDFIAALSLDDAEARRFATGAPLITDDVNLLEMDSPRAMRHPLSAEEWKQVFEPFIPAIEETRPGNRRYLVRRILSRGEWNRALRVAQASPDPVDRLICLGLVRLARGKTTEADSLLRDALRLDPKSPAARFTLVAMHREAYSRDDPEILALAAGATGLQQAIFQGWRLAREKSWAALRKLEEVLAQAKSSDDTYASAVRLRVLWRVHSGDAPLALEAITILNRSRMMVRSDGDILLLARASLVADDSVNLRAALRQLYKRLKRTPQGRKLARAVLLLLPSISSENGLAVEHKRLRARALLVLKKGGK